MKRDFSFWAVPYALIIFIVAGLLWPLSAQALDVPGPADVGRTQSDRQIPERGRAVQKPESQGEQNGIYSSLQAPPGVDKIYFTLKSVEVVNVTAFKPRRIEKIYADDIGKRVPLSRVWDIAREISNAYARNGYFLSYAYVPAQKVATGKVKIIVVEGYIGDIVLKDPALEGNRIVQKLKARLLSKRPVKTRDVEGVLLRLNEFPGLAFRSVMSPAKQNSSTPGAVTLTLLPFQEKEKRTTLGIDNYSSRFLGPHQISLTHKQLLVPLQATTFSASSSPQIDLVNNFSLDHRLPIAADWDLGVNLAYSNGKPGYTLKPQQIKSVSKNYTLSLNYKPLRSRLDNLGMRFALDGRDTDSDTLGTPLVREKVRSLRVGVDYDTFSRTGAFYNAFGITISKGLDVLDASPRGQLNLSRGQARPDYIKINFNYTNVFFAGSDWQILTDTRLQHAPQPLHSSEQFGYGGQSIGRAYDNSEILGDNGLSALVELRYFGLRPESGKWFSVPYAFYDIGKIWNEGTGQPPARSAASAGGGIRFSSDDGMSINIGLAFPLTKPIDTPIYGSGSKFPRILLQTSLSF